MPKHVGIIPKAPTARILLDAGAERVSKDAMYLFGDILEEYSLEVSKKAIIIANHAGRKTIQGKDITIASK